MKKNAVIIVLSLVALWLLTRPRTSGFCIGFCTGWKPAGSPNPNPKYYKYPKQGGGGWRGPPKVNFCHCP